MVEPNEADPSSPLAASKNEDSGYPTQWETHAVLADGSAIELRPIRSSDRTALNAFHQRQSQESIYFRFFRHRPDLSDSELDFFTQVDYYDRMAFVAMLGSTLVAVARYEKLSDRSEAEIAFFVDDDHHGRGLATLMLEYLAAAARHRGLEKFSATVLPENYRMLGVFRKAGFEAKSRFSDGYIDVDIDIAVTEKATTVMADRERQSRIRSVASIVNPSGIVVIGASRTPGAIGHELFLNLTGAQGGAGFQGPVVAVNHSTTEVAGQVAFASVADAVAAVATLGGSPSERAVGVYDGTADPVESDSVANRGEVQSEPRSIDLAIAVIPAASIPEVIEQCAAVGIKSVFVVSSGFSEVGLAGEQRQLELVDLVRSAGLRLIGPNAFGMVNTAPSSMMKALYIEQEVISGPVGLVSQSGPLGVALLQQLATLGVGISTFVGVGNRADVSVNDLLDYWSADEATKVVVMYVENYGNLRNFAAAAKHLARSKSLLAVAPSVPERRDLLSDAGVMLVDNVSQLASQAKVAVTQPVARGDRVAIVGNTSSLARLALESCLANGLSVVVPPSVQDSASQHTILIGDVDTVAMQPSSEPDDYEKVIVATAVAAEVDLILIAIAPTPYLGGRDLKGLLDRVNRSIDKPIVAVGLVGAEQVTLGDLPYFTYPEEAAKALAVHARHGLWRNEGSLITSEAPQEPPVEIDDADRLLALVDQLIPEEEPATDDDRYRDRGEGGERSLTLADEELAAVLSQLELPVADYAIGSDLETLLAGANRIGYPVVLKANIPNRSVGEVGGAAIDLHDDVGLSAAHSRMVDAFGQSMKTAVVQKMVPSAELVRIDLIQDPDVGSQISIGWGRTGSQRRVSVARRYLPLRPGGAKEIVGEFFESDQRSSRRSGMAKYDQASVDVLTAIVQQLEAVAKLTPSVAKFRLDPILLNGANTVIVDVELVVCAWRTNPLSEVRHL